MFVLQEELSEILWKVGDMMTRSTIIVKLLVLYIMFCFKTTGSNRQFGHDEPNTSEGGGM